MNHSCPDTVDERVINMRPNSVYTQVTIDQSEKKIFLQNAMSVKIVWLIIALLKGVQVSNFSANYAVKKTHKTCEHSHCDQCGKYY